MSIVIPEHINFKTLECDEIISIPIVFGIGHALTADGEVCPSTVTVESVKGFIGIPSGLTLKTGIFEGATLSDTIIEIGQISTGEKVKGDLRINVGDTCSLPAVVTIRWKGFDEDGDVCFDEIRNYHISADFTCCFVNNCLNTKLTCD